MDRDLADVLGVVEAEVRPRRAAVCRLVHAVPEADGVAQRGLATADIDDVGRRRRDGDGADGGGGLTVEDGLPDAAGVDRLPDAAVYRAEIELVRPSGHARRRGNTSTA